MQRAALTVAAKAEQHSIGLREVNLTLESAGQCHKRFFESASHLGARLRMQKSELSSLAETDTNLRQHNQNERTSSNSDGTVMF